MDIKKIDENTASITQPSINKTLDDAIQDEQRAQSTVTLLTTRLQDAQAKLVAATSLKDNLIALGLKSVEDQKSTEIELQNLELQ